MAHGPKGSAQAAALGHKAHHLVDLAKKPHGSAGFEQFYAGIWIKLHDWLLRLSVAGAGQKAPAHKYAGIGLCIVVFFLCWQGKKLVFKLGEAGIGSLGIVRLLLCGRGRVRLEIASRG